ncbi:hypothetical protein IAQ61_004256 [Plenodomus lingam]|uniref:uncharacterized protein n=1 Tax=Leptosphaeria maculans TaxID=5022 RepID=UPI00331B0B3D|nr:hypothetical protein IAQ61_004256 [Plenodomus lingam]
MGGRAGTAERELQRTSVPFSSFWSVFTVHLLQCDCLCHLILGPRPINPEEEPAASGQASHLHTYKLPHCPKCMSVHRSLQGLLSAQRAQRAAALLPTNCALLAVPTAVPCRQSVPTFVTVASQRFPPQGHWTPPPPTASPTKPLAEVFKSRALQVSKHLHNPSPGSTPASVSSFSSSSAPRKTPTSPKTPASPNPPPPTMSYTTRRIGAANTLEHRVYIEKDGQLVSPWHDIPLYANEQQTVLNMVVEVPRWTNAKMEISKEEVLNPILQDTKKGKLRFVRNCFPHKGYLWNYGAFPQTWEDPNVVHQETKAKGDNDPLDVCEIGELVAKPGEVIQVKVLGVMALLDEGETDWKIMVINVNDPLAPKLNDVEDVERHLPGLLRATNEWFRIYKIPDGKPENQFAFSGECKNKKYAMDIVRECAEAWEKLATGKTPKEDLSLVNTTVSHSTERTDPKSLNIPPGENKAPAPIDPSIDKWFYISGAPTS